MSEEKKETPKKESKSREAEELKKEEKKEETSAEAAADKKEESKKEVEIPAEFADLVKKIEEMSVLQLSELVKVLEEKFGVSAVPAAVGIAAVGGAPAGEEAVVEEKTSFNIELVEIGESKISVIKAVRAVTELGLKDAKDIVDAAPKVIKEGVSKEEAEEIKKTLEEAGAKVVLK